MTENSHKLKRQNGFTLIEVIIVMIIITLLAALVGPRLFPKLGKGKQAAARAQSELLGQGLDSSGSWTWAESYTDGSR